MQRRTQGWKVIFWGQDDVYFKFFLVLQKQHFEEVLVDDADGFVVGDDQAEAAHDLHGGERGDERVDAEFRDDVAVGGADERADTEAGGDTEGDDCCSGCCCFGERDEQR